MTKPQVEHLAARGLLAPEPVEDEPIAGDAPPGDTYNREQSARILGVSPRRVTQLAADGRLNVIQAKPLRVSAQSVHELREARRSGTRDLRATVPPDPAADVAEQVERVVSLVVAEHRRAIEAGEHLLAEVTASRDDARSEVERLRADVERERAEVERLRQVVEDERAARESALALANAPRRRWWSR